MSGPPVTSPANSSFFSTPRREGSLGWLRDRVIQPLLLGGIEGEGNETLSNPLVFGKGKKKLAKFNPRDYRNHAPSQRRRDMEVGQSQAASMESGFGAGNKDTLFGIDCYRGVIDFVMEWN